MKKGCLLFISFTGIYAHCQATSTLRVEVISTRADAGSVVMSKSGVVAIQKFGSLRLWTPATGFTAVINTTTNGVSARLQPFDINDLGQVTGIAYTNEGGVSIERAFIASKDKPLVLLQNDGSVGSRHGVGLSINNLGTVQGSGNRGSDGDGGYELSGRITTWAAPIYMPVYPTFGYGESFINDAGICLSDYGTIFTPGSSTFTRLQTPSSVSYVQTKVITNGGKIFGNTSYNSGESQTRGWSTDGTLLHSFSPIGSVLDANDEGSAVLGYDAGRTSIWNPIAGTLTPIQSLLDDEAVASGWQIGLAKNIGNQGHILAYATNRDGVGHVVRLAPVPEPATLLALSAGLAGILARRRKGKDSPAPY